MLSQRSNSSSICRLSKQWSHHYCASRTEPRPSSWWPDRTGLPVHDIAAPENSTGLELAQRREKSILSHPDTLHRPSGVVIALVMSLPSARCSQTISEVRVLSIFCIPHMYYQMLCLFKIWDIIILCLWGKCGFLCDGPGPADLFIRDTNKSHNLIINKQSLVFDPNSSPQLLQDPGLKAAKSQTQ